MSSNHGCARARESDRAAAVSWLEAYDPGDGDGPVGEKARDPLSMFLTECVLDSFMGGVEHADQAHAIERATGQRQLDDVTALIHEACGLFERYAKHHWSRADEAEADGDLLAARNSLDKARTNLLMLVRLKSWLAGAEVYPTSLPADCQHVELTRDQPGLECSEERRTYTVHSGHPVYSTKCGITERDKWRWQFQEEGRQARRDGKTTADCPHMQKVPGGRDLFPGVEPGAEWLAGWHEENEGRSYGKTKEACRARFDNIRNFGGGPPIHGHFGCDGEYRFPGTQSRDTARRIAERDLERSRSTYIEGFDYLGEDKDGRGVWFRPIPPAGVFSLSTPDPRFDPLQPVTVNGYLYHPATEAR